jgi:NAD(P)-dependent dehydrogenase (short-subunit alcohol dehydrogenase family)
MSTDPKVAIVTGASQGIGAALVQAFRARDYLVVANSRSIAASADPGIATIAGDVADPKTADLVFAEALGRFGRVDTLVNNAGIFMPSRSRLIQKRIMSSTWAPTSPASFI